MRKILAVILIFMLTPASCFAFFGTKKPAADLQGKGYMGALPDVSKTFATSEPKTAKPIFDETQNFHSASAIKPIPRDNPAFVNIILKTDKTSPYLNDMNEIIPILEKIYDSIESRENVQRFVARVYFFNKNVDYIRDKYAGKPEASYVSFRRLMETSQHAHSISLLRAEAEKYTPYLAYTGAGYIYNPQNIDQQLEYLRAEIEQTIVVLKEAN